MTAPAPLPTTADLLAFVDASPSPFHAVAEVARGISGRDQAQGPVGRFHAFTPRPKEERTYVPEVVAAIEARRRKPKEKPAGKRPRFVRKAVYDDFGEPVRWEWVEQDGK